MKYLVLLLVHYVNDIQQGTLSYINPTLGGLADGLQNGLAKGGLLKGVTGAVRGASDGVAKSTQVGYNNVFKSQMQKEYTPFVGL